MTLISKILNWFRGEEQIIADPISEWTSGDPYIDQWVIREELLTVPTSHPIFFTMFRCPKCKAPHQYNHGIAWSWTKEFCCYDCTSFIDIGEHVVYENNRVVHPISGWTPDNVVDLLNIRVADGTIYHMFPKKR